MHVSVYFKKSKGFSNIQALIYCGKHMKNNLYKKYLKNIKNNKTAIKRKYVDEGFFNYYNKKDIEILSKSNKIIIDGLNGSYEKYVTEIYNRLKNHKALGNKKIYLGKIGPKISNKIQKININEKCIIDYNVSIADYDIQHVFNHHSSKSERKRGQKPIISKDLIMLPQLLVNTNTIIFLGKNKRKLNLYNFVSYNKDGTYNLIEFIKNGKKQFELQTIYIQLSKK